ncbi:hypothetical protein [Burkholderia territorii]|uniref:hypothetical protein n=1 Tax=Burkholderia territorii TaxID=1503055 RepID=UPI00075B3582|nr:hypothetical protein [Burkholderia territorii]KWE26913.1 hypothetical protein WT49_29365 [Burkholderia territorii]KWE41320.1 hypothetical protein WT51_26695 [Burkholderia territorii]KWE42793.1 hypothetical protein WT50_13600 [Burkholderia territorii]
MALYRIGGYFTCGSGRAFRENLPPGSEAIVAGIYRCTICGDEIGIAKAQALPSDDEHRHDLDPPSDPLLDRGPTAWQLIAAAESRH